MDPNYPKCISKPRNVLQGVGFPSFNSGINSTAGSHSSQGLEEPAGADKVNDLISPKG